jgi:hypothetical protein
MYGETFYSLHTAKFKLGFVFRYLDLPRLKGRQCDRTRNTHFLRSRITLDMITPVWLLGIVTFYSVCTQHSCVLNFIHIMCKKCFKATLYKKLKCVKIFFRRLKNQAFYSFITFFNRKVVNHIIYCSYIMILKLKPTVTLKFV